MLFFFMEDTTCHEVLVQTESSKAIESNCIESNRVEFHMGSPMPLGIGSLKQNDTERNETNRIESLYLLPLHLLSLWCNDINNNNNNNQ
mmetsp:Transcript_2272/g.2598  ORF Transcript_2272/g.2598 Transcript_2272/m.2598 type:complete len:89 (-) Transcript_2272:187-453(-)